jgi:hypothetical protein
MKWLAAPNVVARGPHKQINAVKRRKCKPATEQIGILPPFCPPDLIWIDYLPGGFSTCPPNW